jgi:hypothetical protein
MRVALVTRCYTSYNYGAQLAGLALKNSILTLGDYEVDIIRVRHKKVHSLYVAVKELLRQVRCFAFRSWGKHVKEVNALTAGRVYETAEEVGEASRLYDIFVVGSAIIWGDYDGELDFIDTYYLKHVTSPKISYAPSINGGADFSSRLIPHMKPLVNDFERVSVREYVGKQFLDGILDDGKTAFHAVDPTLLLSTNEWDDLLAGGNAYVPRGKYIFVYFVNLNFVDEQRDFIQKFAAMKQLPIVLLPRMDTRYTSKSVAFADTVLTGRRPIDMVSCIKNAEYIMTDSFHCCVFSSKYHKEFYVFKKKMNISKLNEVYTKDKNDNNTLFPRISELLDWLNMGDRHININTELSSLDRIQTNWDLVDEKISVRREECREWLSGALQAAGAKVK